MSTAHRASDANQILNLGKMLKSHLSNILYIFCDFFSFLPTYNFVKVNLLLELHTHTHTHMNICEEKYTKV